MKPLTFKEKKAFYKERQKFFDAVKAANDGEYPVITYKKERYKLVSLDEMNSLPDITQSRDYDYGYGYGHAVVFNKAFKSNQIVEFVHGNKHGLSAWGDNCEIRHDFTRFLCYAIKLNTEEK